MNSQASCRGFGRIAVGAGRFASAFSNRIPPRALVVVTGLFAAGPALAMDAYTRGEVLLHTAPASEEYVRIRHGTHVDVRECAGGWCLVNAGEAEGWIPEEQLALRGQTP